jgi:hypothetical protein
VVTVPVRDFDASIGENSALEPTGKEGSDVAVEPVNVRAAVANALRSMGETAFRYRYGTQA